MEKAGAYLKLPGREAGVFYYRQVTKGYTRPHG
jgi:hypothetical protein